jgi:TatD DNase family protein
MHLIDSHAHLDFRQFNHDRDVVIEQAREAGLIAIVNIGTSLSSSRTTVALAEQHDFIYATVGVHPHDAKTVTPATLDELRELARHPKVVAVGEIGLDYYRDLSPRPVQRQAFADQLALATELGLPVVIHSREANDDVIAALRGWKGTGVLHSYSAGPERLDEVLALGFFISISGPVTFPKASALRAVTAAVPLERLLVETDCPFLTPKPYRGRRNQPAYVQYVVEAVARARKMPMEAITQATVDNARRLFNIL